MNLAIIGRTPLLISIALRLLADGHSVGAIVTPSANGASIPFYELAKVCSADFIETTKINFEPVLHRLRAAACDVAVSLNWQTLFKAETLQAFVHGVLNAHAGDLPAYRGNACANWAILQGEPHIGLCVHEMTPELDAGPVYARATLPLGSDTYVTEIQEWIDATAPELFSQSIAAIAQGVRPVAQNPDPAASLRCYPRRASDARIEWARGVEDVHRLVRASSRPFGGAYCFLDERRITVWRAEIVRPAYRYLAMPGQPCEPMEGDPAIACADGLLRLVDIEVEGLSPNASKAFVNRSVRLRLS